MLDDTEMTRPGRRTARAPRVIMHADLAVGPDPIYTPRVHAIVVAPQYPRPVMAVKPTNVLVLWRLADRIDGGGRDLIREIEGR